MIQTETTNHHHPLSRRVIGAAIAVHRELGPGFLEQAYENALCLEMDKRHLSFERQVEVPVLYDGTEVALHRLDLVVGGEIVVELKALPQISSIHYRVLRSYLQASGLDLGLLINFGGTRTDVRKIV